MLYALRKAQQNHGNFRRLAGCAVWRSALLGPSRARAAKAGDRPTAKRGVSTWARTGLLATAFQQSAPFPRSSG